MTIEEFRRILTTFADSPESYDITKGNLLVQILDEVVEAKVSQRDGDIFVKENDVELSASRWLVNRGARLPLLADRVLSYVDVLQDFVVPEGLLTEQLELANDSDTSEVSDVASEMIDVLGRRPAGTSSVLYLTSDAGEGKTTLINHVARQQAIAYKAKETDWLLVPITLGGRPFLRFDDIIVGSLANRLRFQFFYYDSFLELVRLGVLVPAFDGFEEMFIESSTGEALSALGGLLESLQSSGTILISARKAYFDYKSFASQAKLFDAMKSNSASFASLGIRRWGPTQFLEYSSKRGLTDGEVIYADVKHRLGALHPVLTRAVLVKRLLDVAVDAGTRKALLERLGREPHEYFYQFVDAIIEREVNEKWIDRSGQLAKPLISTKDHHVLLSMIAQELWLANSDALSGDALDIVADMFSEIQRMTPTQARQIKERIKQHALLTSASANMASFAFDHEEFKNFFLGQAIGRCLLEGSDLDLRSVLRAGALPPHVFDSAVQSLRSANASIAKTIDSLQKLGQGDISSSFTRENCGGLIIRLLHGAKLGPLEIDGVTFPPEALVNQELDGISFVECYFQSTGTLSAGIRSCRFEKCRFDRLELSSESEITDVVISDCEVLSLVPANSDHRIFDPKAISMMLQGSGFNVPEAEPHLASTPVQVDEGLEIFEKVLRFFLRSTQLHESTLRTRLGSRASYFFNQLLPILIRAGVIQDVQNDGRANHGIFRLAVEMRDVDEVLRESGGNFETFIEGIQSRSGERLERW